MKPMVHARISAKRYGGDPEDYLPIHDWLDSTKASLPDIRHRAFLHNSVGCFLAEQVFGHVVMTHSHVAEAALRAFKDDPTPENAEAYRVAKAALAPGRKTVSVRDVAEDHIREDLGFIPTLERWVRKMPIEPWMAGGVGRYKTESAPQPVEEKIVA